MNTFPWGPATGVGSMPGGDAREAAKMVAGSFDDFPHLPELPARGPGADMIGRTIGLLVEMYGHVEPSGWRISDRPGRDTRRARSWLGEDLDALEEHTQGYEGPLKVQAVGPWTLAASLELRNGEASLGDPGAVRDLAGSLAEGLRSHMADVQPAGARRPRGAAARRAVAHRRTAGPDQDRQWVSHPQGGGPPGRREHAAGCYRGERRARHDPLVRAGRAVRAAAPGRGRGVSFDFGLLTERDEDQIGEAVEGGTQLFAGVVPSTEAPLSDPAGSVMGVRTLWRRLGLSPGTLSESVVITPTCGLAGASPAYARAALAHCVRAARSLADNPE